VLSTFLGGFSAAKTSRVRKDDLVRDRFLAVWTFQHAVMLLKSFRLSQLNQATSGGIGSDRSNRSCQTAAPH